MSPETVERFDRHRLSLLHDARGTSILDSHKLTPGAVDLHSRNSANKTLILAAAASIMYLDQDARRHQLK